MYSYEREPTPELGAARHHRHALEREAEAAADATAEAAGHPSAQGPQRPEIGALQGPNQPLPPAVRAFYESAYGYDLGAVRTHSGSEADRMLSQTGARALTSGPDIVLGAKAPARTLAHEIAHVVQQRAAPPRSRSGNASVVRPAPTTPAMQFDLAVAPPHPEAEAPTLTADQVAAAIRYNSHRMADPYVFAVIRDVMGVARFPAVVDADFVQAIARWQATYELPVDGRLNEPTVASVVRELRAESALVPSLARDADRVELEAALTFDEGLHVDAATIRTIQGLVHAPATGVWDDATVRAVMAYQRAQHLHPDGMIGPRTLRLLINELVAAARFDDAIHVIVDAHHFPTANLANIQFDATVAGADAITTGVIGTGQPQTVRVGPTTFTAGYEHMIRIIGHELQHVQQRSGATPIANQHVREFLSFAWEALDTGAPALPAADRVNHANIAIGHWNAAPVADRTAQQAVRDRLDQLIAAGGVGNF
jgi:peptidoglycan hydrolase-like protein with peptidoglycan-binding domain